MKINILACLALLILPHISYANSNNIHTKVVTTLPPLSGLVTLLMPKTSSQCLLSAGSDPHHFQPSPRQVALLYQNNILLRASRDDQGWPINTQQSQVFDIWPTQSHAWLQFDAVSQALPKLATTLIATFPKQKSNIQANLTLALSNLKTLQGEWQVAFKTLQKRGVMMQHPAWLGVLNNANVPVWAVLEKEQHGHEQGPKHLEKALVQLKQHPDAILLGSKNHSNRSLVWLNKQTGHQHAMVKLDALGACNQSWLELMRTNLKTLQGAL